jgi:RNA polymerase sigma-70 factor (ECF subfamily)
MTNDRGRREAEQEWESPPSFDVLYDRYRSAVFSFAYYLTRDRREAEDLFQEAWLRIVKHLPERVNMPSLKTWIFTIVANLHRDSLRKKRVRHLFLLRRQQESESENEASFGADRTESRDAAFRADLEREIARAIGNLPERQRRVFILKEISGFKQSEIGDILGIPIGTVKSLMHRAVRRLQKELSAYHSNPMIERIEDAM